VTVLESVENAARGTFPWPAAHIINKFCVSALISAALPSC